jgi:alkylation response protein AidB-like acyl-CoA dehydrogenase
MTMPYFQAHHEELRKSIRKFVESELAPHAQEWEEAAYFADWVFPRMGELGFLGLHYPTEYGGQRLLLFRGPLGGDGALSLRRPGHGGGGTD